MNKNELDIKIKFAIANIRNLIYYYEIDDRPCAQYIHILRKYRSDLIDLINLFPEDYLELKNKFLGIIRLIDPKLAAEDCMNIISSIKNYIYEYWKTEEIEEGTETYKK